MSERGSLSVEPFESDVTTHTADGASTEKHAFVRLRIDTGASGLLVVELDAGEFSRILARPRTATPVELQIGHGPVSRAG